MSPVRASLVLPVYNKAEYLMECLDSLFGQTFSDLEVVAVDDKSTDNSLEILRSVKDPRLRVIALERNLGHPGATRTAMDHARGEYIVRCDADDIFHPERVARQVAYMDANPGTGASGCALRLFGNSDAVWYYPAGNDDCQARVLFTTPMHDGALIVRRSVLEEHGLGFRKEWPRVGGDWLFMLELSRVTRFGNLDDVLVYYRHYEGNISNKARTLDARKEGVRIAMGMLGLKVGEEEVECHMALTRTFLRRPDVHLVRGMSAWADRLEAHAVGTGKCSAGAFARLRRDMDNDLFHRISDLDPWAALEYMRQRRMFGLTKLSYLAKVRTRILLGLPAHGKAGPS